MKRPTNRFERGSGCFTCRDCKRRTRATGGDNDGVGLCAECYELAGVENSISDCGSTPELQAEAARLRAIIAAKAAR